MDKVTASARKSLGSYKPLLKYPGGKTEVVECNPERLDWYTREGVRIKGNKYARGNTYETRNDAIEAANLVIEERLAVLIETEVADFLAGKVAEKFRAKRRDYLIRKIALWGGNPDDHIPSEE